MLLEHRYNSFQLFVIPVWRQLADAPLNSGLAGIRWLYGHRRQQCPRLTDVVENFGHLSGGAREEPRCVVAFAAWW